MSGTQKKSVSASAPARFWKFALFAVLLFSSIFRLYAVRTTVQYTPDERQYARMAKLVADGGSQALAPLAAEYRRNPALFELPSPARVGFIYPTAVMMRVTGIENPGLLQALSAIYGIATLLLLAKIVWRYLGPMQAFVAVTLLGFSPIALAVSRRGWQESFIALNVMAVLYYARRAIENETWYWLGGAGVLAGFALSVKETDVAACGLVILMVLAVFLLRRRWVAAAILSGSSLVSLGLVAVWMGSQIGGVGWLPYFTRKTMYMATNSAYAVQTESGTLGDWIQMWWYTDGALLLLFAATLVAGWWLSRRVKIDVLVWAEAIFSLLAAAAPLSGGHGLDLRFGAMAIASMAIVIAWGAGAACEMAGRAWAEARNSLRVAILVSLGLISVINLARFQSVIEQTDLQDLCALFVLQNGAGQK